MSGTTSTVPSRLGSSTEALSQAYDLAMLDLDGVVYVGGHAVPGAPEHLAGARADGMRLAFITNNASRTPGQIAGHLTQLGVAAEQADVVTAAQAAARVLREQYDAGTRIAVLGAVGLEEALTAEELVPVGPGDEASAIVTGYGPDVPWRDIMRAAARVADGLPWVASNTDASIPTPYGSAPGHGMLVALVRDFSGVEPVVAGKPARPLLDETVRRVGGRRPLMVGDRLDTDIAGARGAGVDSLLVLTGVSGLAEVVAASPEQRPTYLAPDLAGLRAPHPASVEDGPGRRLGGWQAAVVDGQLEVRGSGSAADWWRVVADVAWAHRDRSGSVVGSDRLTPPPPEAGAADGTLTP